MAHVFLVLNGAMSPLYDGSIQSLHEGLGESSTSAPTMTHRYTMTEGASSLSALRDGHCPLHNSVREFFSCSFDFTARLKVYSLLCKRRKRHTWSPSRRSSSFLIPHSTPDSVVASQVPLRKCEVCLRFSRIEQCQKSEHRALPTKLISFLAGSVLSTQRISAGSSSPSSKLGSGCTTACRPESSNKLFSDLILCA